MSGLINREVEWEMRKGKWILLDNSQLTGQYALLYKSDDWMNYQCSCCNYMVHNSLKESYDYRTAFCPNCRAKMEVDA